MVAVLVNGVSVGLVRTKINPGIFHNALDWCGVFCVLPSMSMFGLPLTLEYTLGCSNNG